MSSLTSRCAVVLYIRPDTQAQPSTERSIFGQSSVFSILLSILNGNGYGLQIKAYHPLNPIRPDKTQKKSCGVYSQGIGLFFSFPYSHSLFLGSHDLIIQWLSSSPSLSKHTLGHHSPSHLSGLSGRVLRPPFRLFMRLRKPPPPEGFSPSLLPGRGLSAVILLVSPSLLPVGIAELADRLRCADGLSCSAIRIWAPLRAYAFS